MGVGISPGQNLLESSILGGLHSFNFCFWVMGQSNWLIATKKKVGLVRHRQLIDMKQNKYPQFHKCFLQGVLAEAKNGDELFWEVKFHAANGKALACPQGA